MRYTRDVPFQSELDAIGRVSSNALLRTRLGDSTVRGRGCAVGAVRVRARSGRLRFAQLDRRMMLNVITARHVVKPERKPPGETIRVGTCWGRRTTGRCEPMGSSSGMR